jgi:O-antigen ligase
MFNAFFRFSGLNDLGVSFAMPFFQDRGSGSAYIVFAFCAGISLFVRYKTSRWWVLPGLFIMLAAIGLAGARAALLGVAAVLLLVLIRAGKNMLPLASALGIIALAAVVVLNSTGTDLKSSFISSWLARFQNTLGYFDTESEFAINERFHLWNTALNMTLSNPLLGVGYDQFRYRLPEFASPEGNLGVHHEFLKVLTESGIVAFLTYLYMILGGISRGVRKCFRIPRSFAAQDWAALACLAYAIQGCFNNFQQVAKVTVPFMMAISALWRLPKGRAQAAQYLPPTRTVALEP